MPRRDDIESILLIGSGPIVIGQACEFDYSGTQACKALRDEGYRVILINSNPATIMTDPETADATYVEPLTVDVLEKVIVAERPSALPGDPCPQRRQALREPGLTGAPQLRFELALDGRWVVGHVRHRGDRGLRADGQLAGRVGQTLYTLRAGRAGTIRVEDRHGNALQYPAYSAASEDIAGGTPVLLTRWDRERKAFEVEVAPAELAP